MWKNSDKALLIVNSINLNIHILDNIPLNIIQFVDELYSEMDTFSSNEERK